MAADDDDKDESVEPKKKKKRVLFFAIIFIIVLFLGSCGYLGFAYLKSWFPFEPSGPTPEEIAAELAKKEESLKSQITEEYITFDQGFTFNLLGGNGKHIMQLEVALLVIGNDNVELANLHKQLIASVISEIGGKQNFEDLVTQSGRQRLKRLLLEGIRAKLSSVAKQPVVEQVLFTNFVMQ